MIVLDTNVLSELMRPQPTTRVDRWFAVQPACSVFITTVSQAEIFYGIGLMKPGRRKSLLAATAERMFKEDFRDRLLSFDAAAAEAYADIAVRRRRVGRPISTLDAQIAAIALTRGAALVTRNVADFEDCGIDVFNPWTD